MGVGDNIRALRTREHLSQAELAKRLSVTKETVSRWETSKSFIRKAHLEKFIEVFGVTADDVLSEGLGFASEPSVARDPSSGAGPNDVMQLPYPVYKVERSGNGTTLRRQARRTPRLTSLNGIPSGYSCAWTVGK